MISLDLETALIDRAQAAPPPVCATLDPGGLFLIADARDKIRDLLESDELIVGAFVAFDMAVLGEYEPSWLPLIFAKYQRGQIEDVILRQKIIDIATRGTGDELSLEDLCIRYKLPPVDKSGPWRTEFWALRNVPVAYWPPGAVAYCLADVDRPRLVYREQEAYAQAWYAKCGEPLLHLSGREAYKQFVLYLITCWGFKAHPARVAALRNRLARYMRHAKHWLVRQKLVRPDGTRDTKAAQARMLARMGDRARKTDGGGISLDKEACAESGDGLLQLYSEYSQSTTLSSRVDDLAAGVDLPLQVRFNSLLETSRTSTSKPSPPLVGVQAQNFPRKAGARECIEPRPGHVFVSADLPSAELRSLSQVNTKLWGRSVMADQLNAGRDLHLWFGAQILGRTYEDAWENAKDKTVKGARQNAKPCNFGFPGGMGIDNFMTFAWATYRVKFERRRAEDLKKIWLGAFPEMKEYFGWINRLLGDRDRALMKCVMTGRWVGRRTYCQACNLQFQELTATAASDGLAETQRRAYTDRSSALFRSRAILYTHDARVLETPKDQAHEAGMELSAVMADRFSALHPDVPALPCTGPTKDPRVVQPVVSLIYSKDMESVWKNDRLVPWTGPSK